MLRKFLYSLGPILLVITINLIARDIIVKNTFNWLYYIVYIILLMGYNGLLVYLFRYLRPGEILNEFVDISCRFNLLNIFTCYIIMGILCINVYVLEFTIIWLILLSVFNNFYILNPVFYIFGYKYYYKITCANKLILVLSKRKYLSKEDMNIKYCVFFDDNTAIDINENN